MKMKIDCWFKKREDFYAGIFMTSMTDIFVCSIYLEWPLNPMKNTMARHLFGARLRNALKTWK